MSQPAAAAMILLGSLVLYLLACIFRPTADCFRCAGTGRHRHIINGARMTCARCNGTGDRTRAGRRAWIRMRARAAARRAATR